MRLTRKEVNDIFGWVDDFAPRDPERIRQDIAKQEEQIRELRSELKCAAKWHAQKAAYEAIVKHAAGEELTDDEIDAMGNIACQPYEDYEVAQ